jgi:hypothetical protein
MEKLERVKQCAEERSTLQFKCIDELDLNIADKKKGIGKLKYYYDKCIKDNAHLYPCLEGRDTNSIKY